MDPVDQGAVAQMKARDRVMGAAIGAFGVEQVIGGDLASRVILLGQGWARG
jgi:hypothetical protein